MSRSGYSDDYENPWLWMRAVQNAIRGKRGQAFLNELLETLDAMPEKRLITDYLEHEGEVCAIGSVGLRRGLNMSQIDCDDAEQVGNAFGLARAMAAEIEYVNDEDGRAGETPDQRWVRVRRWVSGQIVAVATPTEQENEKK